jgi:predicted PurR-regulated permease PerM
MTTPDIQLEHRIASRLLDVLIRAGLIVALALLCYRIFSPFLTLMVWALILAVTLYPLHQMLAARMGGRQGWSATVLTLLGVVLIVAPTAVLMSSLGDSIQQLITDMQNNTLKIPAPRDGVATWPLVGDRVHALWSRAHADLPALIQSMQPQIGDIARSALAFVAGIGVSCWRSSPPSSLPAS